MEPRRQVNRQWLRQIHNSAAPGYAFVAEQHLRARRALVGHFQRASCAFGGSMIFLPP